MRAPTHAVRRVTTHWISPLVRIKNGLSASGDGRRSNPLLQAVCISCGVAGAPPAPTFAIIADEPAPASASCCAILRAATIESPRSPSSVTRPQRGEPTNRGTLIAERCCNTSGVLNLKSFLRMQHLGGGLAGTAAMVETVHAGRSRQNLSTGPQQTVYEFTNSHWSGRNRAPVLGRAVFPSFESANSLGTPTVKLLTEADQSCTYSWFQ
mmetsp:Transcript_54656/g.122305  ORF Transcript_54656/g.122305 Transcript_54656/m.122305 type:complete len:210 (+) Transcript_54656:85-714(+)